MRELHRSYLVKNIGDKSAKYNWDAVNVRSITRIFATSKLSSLAGYKHHRHFPWCFLLKCKFLSLSSLDLFSFGVMLLWFPQLHAGRAPVSKTLWGRWPHTHFPVSPWMYAFQFYSSNHLRLVVKKHLSCKFIYRLDNIDDTFSLLTFFVGRLLVQDL